MRAILGVLLLALALPATAAAGGFTTVGLESLPEKVAPGDTWRAEFTVLGHGRADSPLAGLKPSVVLTDESGRSEAFPARETAKRGHYVAAVTFPSSGRWNVAIRELDFAQTHDFGTVAIGTGPPVTATPAERPAAQAPADDGGPDLLAALLAALAAGLLAGGAAWLVQRRTSGGGEAPALG
jgi:hypothetical protein